MGDQDKTNPFKPADNETVRKEERAPKRYRQKNISRNKQNPSKQHELFLCVRHAAAWELLFITCDVWASTESVYQGCTHKYAPSGRAEQTLKNSIVTTNQSRFSLNGLSAQLTRQTKIYEPVSHSKGLYLEALWVCVIATSTVRVFVQCILNIKGLIRFIVIAF